LSGGAGYDNLDPSFATDDPTGSGKVQQADGRYDCPRRPRAARRLEKIHRTASTSSAYGPTSGCSVPGPIRRDELFYALEEPGKSYAVYFRGADKPRRTKFSMDYLRAAGARSG
jgi:hypothetical protein